MPKTTVWHHIQKVQVLPKYIPILESKRGGSEKLAERRWKEARKKAQKLLQGREKELLVAAAMLYWGKGSKRNGCEFINSNGKMLKFYLNALRKAFRVPRGSIVPTMRIFSGMDKDECLTYWSKITGIRKSRFVIWVDNRSPRGRIKYGMCRITVRKGGNVLKLMHSLIDLYSDEALRIKHRRPRSSIGRAAPS